MWEPQFPADLVTLTEEIRNAKPQFLSSGMKKKKTKINSKNKDNKCFQYTAKVALNYGKIESHPEKV